MQRPCFPLLVRVHTVLPWSVRECTDLTTASGTSYRSPSVFKHLRHRMAHVSIIFGTCSWVLLAQVLWLANSSLEQELVHIEAYPVSAPGRGL